MKTIIKECGKCGSKRLNDLGEKFHEFDHTVICMDCNAHWWKKWYTNEEWEVYVNSLDVPPPKHLTKAEYIRTNGGRNL